MIKSWFISLFVLILLGLAYYVNLFEWLAGGSAFWLGIVLVVAVMIAGFFVLGNPFVKK